MSSARKSLGRPSPSVAPAARRARSRRSRDRDSSPPVSSTSISRKRLTALGLAQHPHGVEHDLGDGARASRTSTPWRRDCSVATGTSGAPRAKTVHEVDHLGRWEDVSPGAPVAGPAPTALSRVVGQIELEPRLALGQLELPQALAALDAAAEGDTRHRQPMIRGVQVDVGERARGQRLARQSGEAKPRPGAELQLALERGLHLPGRRPTTHGHDSH